MNELTKQGQVTVKSLLAAPAYKTRFEELLRDNAPQFMSSLIQISQDWKLKNCDPHSVIAASMTAASLDLPINPNLGFAWIIPYKDKASFQLGYKGLVQLANRSGQYNRINVIEVYEGELVKVDRLTSDLTIDPAQRTSDKIVGYAAYFRLSNGHEHAEYWDVATVQKHAKRFSQAFRAGKQDSPWFTDFDAMAKKTVLKSLLSHWGPLSVAMQKAVVEDGGQRALPDSEISFPDSTEPEQSIPVESETAQVEDKKKPKEITIQDELHEFVVMESKFTFGQLMQWGQESGNIPDASSIPDFDSIPADVCKRLLRAKAGLIKGLEAIK